MSEPTGSENQYDQKLAFLCRPPQWKNPEPGGRYNLVIIGAGSAGLVAAYMAAEFGARVALVEKNQTGGDCLNVGCVPSKGVIRAARYWSSLEHASDFGIQTGVELERDFSRAMTRMRRLRSEIAEADSAEVMRGRGVDVYFGEGKFTGLDRFTVAGAELEFHRALIATGSRPDTPPIKGVENVPYLTNETLFDLVELPPRLGVIGGGPIGCEMAQAFSRFGSEVLLVELGSTLLPRDEPEASELVTTALARDSVDLRLDTRCTEIEMEDAEIIMHLDGPGAAEERVDRLLVAAGRAPNTLGLGLEAAAVDHDGSGINVDSYLRTSNPRIFAAGDVCHSYKFTHTAVSMARRAVQNALFSRVLIAPKKRFDTSAIPWCTYTSPEVAHTGLTEKEAREKGHRVKVYLEKMDHNDRAILDGEKGLVKIVVDQKKGRIRGATVVASHAGEMINILTLAVRHGLLLSEISNTIFPYPTQAEAIARAADAFVLERTKSRHGKLLKKWLTRQL